MLADGTALERRIRTRGLEPAARPQPGRPLRRGGGNRCDRRLVPSSAPAPGGGSRHRRSVRSGLQWGDPGSPGTGRPVPLQHRQQSCAARQTARLVVPCPGGRDPDTADRVRRPVHAGHRFAPAGRNRPAPRGGPRPRYARRARREGRERDRATDPWSDRCGARGCDHLDGRPGRRGVVLQHGDRLLAPARDGAGQMDRANARVRRVACCDRVERRGDRLFVRVGAGRRRRDRCRLRQRGRDAQRYFARGGLPQRSAGARDGRRQPFAAELAFQSRRSTLSDDGGRRQLAPRIIIGSWASSEAGSIRRLPRPWRIGRPRRISWRTFGLARQKFRVAALAATNGRSPDIESGASCRYERGSSACSILGARSSS